jgi:predicted RNA-binding protein with PUA-like domain
VVAGVCFRVILNSDVPITWFLAKTDPETYSLDDLAREKHTVWDGVTNPQAVRAIREMRPKDRLLIYHSGGDAAIVGLARVVSEPRDDPKNAKSAVVEVEFERRLDTPVTLAEIKQSGKFADWALVRQGRLSTMRVPEEFIAWLRERGVKL